MKSVWRRHGAGATPGRGAIAALAVVGLLGACGGAGTSVEATTVARIVAKDGARAAVARALAETGRGDDAAAARWLDAVWPRRAELHDDRAVRAAVAALPEGVLTPSLRGPWHVEQARRALEADRPDRVREHLAAHRHAVTAAPGAVGWTAARAMFVAAALEPPEAAEHRLSRVPKSLPGEVGKALAARARLTAAGLAHASERFKPAIAGYLSLGPETGFYREARLGLAWCQLRLGHPQRTLEILALLPGGLAGDPERAVLAAMGAHMVGHVDGAKGVVDKALGAAERWAPERAGSDAVLAAIDGARGVVLLRDPDDDLVETLAHRAATRALGRELLAARAEGGGDPAREAYAKRLEEAWGAHLTAAVAAEAARVQRAMADLRTLRPQLVPLAPPP